MGRARTVSDAGDKGWFFFVFLFPCCFPLFLWKGNYTTPRLFLALAFWISLVAMVSALIVRFEVHNKEEWSVFPAEERLLDTGRYTDGLFCSGVHLQPSPHTPIFAYSTAHIPALRTDRRVTFTLQRKFHLEGEKYMRFGVYLTPESNLAAGICSEGGAARMFLMQDDCDFDDVSQKPGLTSSCVVDSVRFEANETIKCNSKPWPGKWADASTDDTAGQFFVIYQAEKKAHIKAVVGMNRSSYEFPAHEQNLQVCNGTDECFLYFSSDTWGGRRKIVDVQVWPVNRDWMSVRAMCIPNVLAYAMFFFGVTAFLILLSAGFTYWLHRRRATRRALEQRNGAETSDVHNEESAINLEAENELKPILRT